LHDELGHRRHRPDNFRTHDANRKPRSDSCSGTKPAKINVSQTITTGCRQQVRRDVPTYSQSTYSRSVMPRARFCVLVAGENTSGGNGGSACAGENGAFCDGRGGVGTDAAPDATAAAGPLVPDEAGAATTFPVHLSGLLAASGSAWLWLVYEISWTPPIALWAEDDEGVGDGGTSAGRVKNDRSSTKLLRSACCGGHDRQTLGRPRSSTVSRDLPCARCG
jgi:hypothetical protein